MNENIDLTKILKDCPKGWKFYTTVWGEAEFVSIDEKFDYPIRIKERYGTRVLKGNGRWSSAINAECIIFPSKNQRDWSKFTAPWYKQVELVELKESDDEKIRRWIIDDIRYNMNNEPLNNSEYKKKAEKAIDWLEEQRDKDKLIQELGEYKVKYTQEVLEKYINSMSNKNDERLRKTTIAFLKDFAEQGYGNAVECIDWLEKQGDSLRVNDRAWLYLVSDVLTWKCGVGQYIDNPRVQELAKRLCSEYAQKPYNPSVFSNSSNTGKNEQKFDPKTLQPFDKILVKGNKMDCVWKCSLHSHFDANYRHSFCANTGIYRMCIPYNDETKHLLGTTDEAPEYYRYWED